MSNSKILTRIISFFLSFFLLICVFHFWHFNDGCILRQLYFLTLRRSFTLLVLLVPLYKDNYRALHMKYSVCQLQKSWQSRCQSIPLTSLIVFNHVNEHWRSWPVVDKAAHKQEVEIYWWLLFSQPVWLDWDHYFFFADLHRQYFMRHSGMQAWFSITKISQLAHPFNLNEKITFPKATELGWLNFMARLCWSWCKPGIYSTP